MDNHTLWSSMDEEAIAANRGFEPQFPYYSNSSQVKDVCSLDYGDPYANNGATRYGSPWPYDASHIVQQPHHNEDMMMEDHQSHSHEEPLLPPPKTRWSQDSRVNKVHLVSEERKLSREEKRRRRRASIKYRTAHATRERMRVEAFNSAFGTLRTLLPTLPPDKKLSKIEILRLAICYIKYLDNVLKPECVGAHHFK